VVQPVSQAKRARLCGKQGKDRAPGALAPGGQGEGGKGKRMRGQGVQQGQGDGGSLSDRGMQDSVEERDPSNRDSGGDERTAACSCPSPGYTHPG